jgi:hypothetical protein
MRGRTVYRETGRKETRDGEKGEEGEKKEGRGKLRNTSITSIAGVLRKLGTGTYTGLNQLVCIHPLEQKA